MQLELNDIQACGKDRETIPPHKLVSQHVLDLTLQRVPKDHIQVPDKRWLVTDVWQLFMQGVPWNNGPDRQCRLNRLLVEHRGNVLVMPRVNNWDVPANWKKTCFINFVNLNLTWDWTKAAKRPLQAVHLLVSQTWLSANVSTTSTESDQRGLDAALWMGRSPCSATATAVNRAATWWAGCLCSRLMCAAKWRRSSSGGWVNKPEVNRTINV